MLRPWSWFALESRHSWAPLWQSLYRFWKKRVWVIVGVALAMLVFDYFGALYSWEMASLDFLLRHKSGNAQSNYIQVVEITDDDYAALFCNRSPLNTCTLRNLILAIAKGEPSVIAVDLDVSESDLPQQIDAELPKLAFKSRLPTVVWAQVTEPLREGAEEIVLKETPAACQSAAGAPAPDFERWGVPLFPLDRDGIVRRYQRWVKVSKCGAEQLSPTLPFAAFRIADPIAAARNADEKSADDLIFRFTGDRYGFDITDASHILDGQAACAPGPDRAAPCAPASAHTPDFTGKIVLLGGDFTAAHDRYRTPMGERAGVELMAHAIESEIRGGGFGEANLVYSFLFDLAVGHVLLLFYYWWRPRHALVFGPFAALLLSLFLSWVAFHYLAYWLSFIPVVCGVVVHEVRDELKEKREHSHRSGAAPRTISEP